MSDRYDDKRDISLDRTHKIRLAHRLAVEGFPDAKRAIEGREYQALLDHAYELERELSVARTAAAAREPTEAMVEAAAKQMAVLVTRHIIEQPRLKDWQPWAGAARSILEAALTA